MKFELTDKELKTIARRRRWDRKKGGYYKIGLITWVTVVSIAALLSIQDMGKGRLEYVLPNNTVVTSNGAVYFDGILLPQSKPFEVSPFAVAGLVLVICGLGYGVWAGYKDYQDEQAEYESFINKAKETGSIN